jgi:hypothetical protein
MNDIDGCHGARRSGVGRSLKSFCFPAPVTGFLGPKDSTIHAIGAPMIGAQIPGLEVENDLGYAFPCETLPYAPKWFGCLGPFDAFLNKNRTVMVQSFVG